MSAQSLMGGVFFALLKRIGKKNAVERAQFDRYLGAYIAYRLPCKDGGTIIDIVRIAVSRGHDGKVVVMRGDRTEEVPEAKAIARIVRTILLPG